MPRRIPTTCNDCHDGEFPIFHGHIISKGARPYRYCTECGKVIDGSPGILAHLYRWWTGRWPWQDKT